jgi:hypothetical protein
MSIDKMGIKIISGNAIVNEYTNCMKGVHIGV